MTRLALCLALFAMIGCASTPEAPPPQPPLAPQPTAARPPERAAPTPAPALDASWGVLRELVGSWEGRNEQEQSTGTMTLAADLGGRVLVRRGTNDSPRGHHEDLMIIRPGEGGSFRADYFDNEGHVIRYGVTVGADAKHIVFTSEEAPGAPRFKLTYERTAPDDLAIVFEMGAPGGELKRYVGGTVHRHGPR